MSTPEKSRRTLKRDDVFEMVVLKEKERNKDAPEEKQLKLSDEPELETSHYQSLVKRNEIPATDKIYMAVSSSECKKDPKKDIKVPDDIKKIQDTTFKTENGHHNSIYNSDFIDERAESENKKSPLKRFCILLGIIIMICILLALCGMCIAMANNFGLRRLEEEAVYNSVYKKAMTDMQRMLREIHTELSALNMTMNQLSTDIEAVSSQMTMSDAALSDRIERVRSMINTLTSRTQSLEGTHNADIQSVRRSIGDHDSSIRTFINSRITGVTNTLNSPVMLFHQCSSHTESCIIVANTSSYTYSCSTPNMLYNTDVSYH